jgi:hypothetical protein
VQSSQHTKRVAYYLRMLLNRRGYIDVVDLVNWMSAVLSAHVVAGTTILAYKGYIHLVDPSGLDDRECSLYCTEEASLVVTTA